LRRYVMQGTFEDIQKIARKRQGVYVLVIGPTNSGTAFFDRREFALDGSPEEREAALQAAMPAITNTLRYLIDREEQAGAPCPSAGQDGEAPAETGARGVR